MDKLISIKDVAKSAGVSIATVSNVLNGTKYVSEPLRARVLKAVDDLHYEVNMIAKGLKSGKTNNLAIIVSSLTSVFFPPLLQSIESIASAHGYTVSVFATGGDLQKEINFVQMLKSLWIGGIFISSCADVSSSKSSDYIKTLSSLQFNNSPIPVICLESELGTKLDAVVVDDEEGIAAAVNHLYSIGRKRIAYIAFPEPYTMGKVRKHGYEHALKKLGLPFNKKIVASGDSSPKSGYDCMNALLSTGEKIDAVVAGNDQMAIGAIRAIYDAGFSIPEDIAVVGYDDNFPASLVQLTTINIPREDMGKSAFDLFLRRVENPESSRMLIRLNGSLVVRSSTIKSAKSDWDLNNW